MLHFYLLASLAVISVSVASPVLVPIRISGESFSISKESKTINTSNNSGRGPHGKCSQTGEHKENEDSDTPPAPINAKALYFLSNAAQNEVVALKVAADGTLSDGSLTCTGGAGMTGVDAQGVPAIPDALFSQGAVKVLGNSLVAVNAGSNTVSMFNIDLADPTKLTMVGTPVDTLGEFPVSVALSATLNMACVANSGAKAGIACFSMDSSKGLTPLDTALRVIDLGQTTPPIGPTNTVSQTFFNADSTALLTTVKGDPPTNRTGFLSSFPVVNGAVATQDTRSTPAGTAVLFGAALIHDSNNIFVTDASFGSATLEISQNNTATVSASTKIADQKATCWAAISDITNTAFVTDVAVNHLVEVDTKSGEIVSTLNSTNGNPGMIDLVAAGNFVYALSPGNNATKAAVTVFDISAGRGCMFPHFL